MIIEFNKRPIAKIDGTGYEKEEIEAIFDHPGVEVYTNDEVDYDFRQKGGAPKRVRETIEEIDQ